MKPKLLVTIIILTLFGLVTCLAPELLLGNTGLDINLHDTYFVFAAPSSHIAYIIMVLFFVFWGRCITGRFRSKWDNCLLLVFIFLVQLGFISLIKLFSKFNELWNTYPSLQQLPTPATHKSVPSLFELPILSTIQIILTLLLVIVAIITGKNWYKSTNETIS